MLLLADIGFFVFHTLLILFNMLGWIWRRTRVWHLITLGLTSFSWFVMGAFYGWGYCLSTDWHFQIRRQMGHADPESSYTQLLARVFFGIDMSKFTADVLTGGIYVLIVIVTAIVWTRELRRRGASRSPR